MMLIKIPQLSNEVAYGQLSLKTLAERIEHINVSKGFDTVLNVYERQKLLAKLMLVITEIAEAVEEIRHEKVDEEKFWEEIADVFIRLLGVCGGMKKDIYPVIDAKMNKNKARPQMHGKAI